MNFPSRHRQRHGFTGLDHKDRFPGILLRINQPEKNPAVVDRILRKRLNGTVVIGFHAPAAEIHGEITHVVPGSEPADGIKGTVLFLIFGVVPQIPVDRARKIHLHVFMERSRLRRCRAEIVEQCPQKIFRLAFKF